MGVKLQLVLGLILFSLSWITSSTSTEINSTKFQEHLKDDRIRNVIEKQPKTESEIKYVNKNISTNVKTSSDSKFKQEKSASPEISENVHEKQNEVEKDVSIENYNNTIKKDAAPKRREGTGRSIDIDKYLSPEFQNNEFTLPEPSDTEKYLDEPIEFKTSTKKGSDFDHTTPKTPVLNKITDPIQKLEQEYEESLKSREQDHHFDNDDDEHFEIDHNHGEEHDSDHEVEGPSLDEDITIDKMLERDGSPPKNISVNWEMKISDTDAPESKKNKNFTVVKYRTLDYVSHYNDTKMFPDEQKGEQDTLNTTTLKPITSTIRKSNFLTKPPSNKNNSHLLSNKIETETIKAINIVTTELPSTRKPKGENGVAKTDSTTPSTIVTQIELTTKSGIEANNNKSALNNVQNTTHVKNEIKKLTLEVGTTEQTTSDSIPITKRTNMKIRGKLVTSNFMGSDGTTFLEQNPSTVPVVSTTEQTISREPSTIPVTTISEQSISTNTPIFTEQDIFIGTDVTTNKYVEIITNRFGTSTLTTKSELPMSTTPTTEFSETTTEFYTSTTPISKTTTSAEDSTSTSEVPTIFTTTTGIVTTTEWTTVTNVPTNTDVTETPSNETTTESTSETTSKLMETTESVSGTSTANELMSDGTTIIMPGPVPEADTTATPTVTVTAAIVEVSSSVNTETSTEPSAAPTKPSPTSTNSEVSFVHVQAVGTNHTTFVPDTLSPNFIYPIVNNDTKERTVNKVTVNVVSEESTTEESEETTGTSSTETIMGESENNKGKIAAIAISSVGAVCLVILAGLLYIMKKRQKKFNYKQRCRPVSLDDYSVDNLSVYNNSVRRKGADRQSKRSYGNPAFEDPNVTSHPLNFPALAKFSTNVEDMKAEFEEIPQITARTSELPEGCEDKNRYANVIPLPETRVYLKPIQGVPNSDYINANYVTGPKNTKAYYIACQAPMQNTVDDFWRMIWEQQCKVILMITHLFENGVEKCVDYLPPSEVLDCHRLFGDFQVTLKKREAKEKYIISSIQLKNMVSNSWREVTHFWYLGWPEKGVPSEANALIAFLIEARSYMKTMTLDKDMSPDCIKNDPSQNEHNPVVVHCSPGTGRTGVVIACDIAIREFEKNRLVDIPRIVYRIRRDRANAVQTKEQYMFIYKVISLYATKLTGGALDTF